MTRRRRRKLRERVAELEADRPSKMRVEIVGLDLLGDTDADDDATDGRGLCECDRDDCIFCIDFL